MLTTEKLRIYRFYQGDDSPMLSKDAAKISNSDWSQIDKLLQELWSERNRMLLNEPPKVVQGAIREACQDEASEKLFYKIASKWWVRIAFDTKYRRPWYRPW